MLDASLLEDAVDEALRILNEDRSQDRLPSLEAEIERVEGERTRLVAAVASGGNLEALVAGLKAREERLTDLRRRVESTRAEKRVAWFDQTTTRRELLTLARDWRKVLATDPTNARPIVSALLDGRVTAVSVTAPTRAAVQGDNDLHRPWFSEKAVLAPSSVNSSAKRPVDR